MSNRKMTTLKAVCTAVTFTLTALQTPAAQAYNYGTHSRIAELAVRAMRVNETNIPVAPPGVDPADFEVYYRAVLAAPDSLKMLYTGLQTSLAQSDTGLIPLGSDAPYPFSHDDSGSCPLLPGETRNLNALDNFQIKDLNCYPERTADQCGLSIPDTDPTITNLASQGRPVADRSLELLMGWHAGSVDDHVNDTVLWIRPTLVGWYGVYFEAASLAVEVVGGAILLPFVCLYEAIFGGGCHAGDSFALSQKYNPVDFVQGLIPGVGDTRGATYTGLWHFEAVNASINRFNDTRGMWYPGAGPSYPGAFDVVIGAGSQLIGLSLDAIASDGDNNFGQYDKVGRLFPEWQAHTIGMLEFSPLHNLAKYGWDKFVSSGFEDAAGLAWPLHAIGDACEPHHVVGSSAWGHRPYEEYIDHQPQLFLPPSDLGTPADPVTSAAGKAQLTRALVGGYRWWKQFHSGEDIAGLVHQLAVETRASVSATGDWPYQDDDSTIWEFSNADGEKDLGQDVFPQHLGDAQALLENAISAAIAVLTEASSRIPAQVPARNINCPAGQSYVISEPNHVTGDSTPGCSETPSTSSAALIDLRDAGIVSLSQQDAGATSSGGGGGAVCTTGACATDGDCQATFLCESGCCVAAVVK